MRFISNSSIKVKFIIMLVLSSILPIIVLGAYSYVNTLKSLDSQARTSSLHALDRISAFMDLNLLQISNYADNLSQDNRITSLLQQKSSNSADEAEKGRKIELEIQSESKGITIPIRAFIIMEDGEHFENLTYDSQKINEGIRKIEAADWYKNNNRFSDQTRFIGVKPSYIEGFESSYHYYFYHNIYDSDGDFTGIVLLDINNYVFDRLLGSIVDSGSDIIYMTDDSFNILSSSNESRDVPADTASQLKHILSGSADPGSSRGLGGSLSRKYTVVTSKLINTNWTLFYLAGRQSLLSHSNDVLVFTTGLIGILLIIGFLLYLFVNKTITKPIIRLSKAMSRVQKGELDVLFPVVSTDEIGILSNGFNKMISEIKGLIDKVKQEERQLKDLEFSMLQAQINPHFLSNSLNGIKWMADFMGCGNISQAVSCLVKLLQYSIGKSESTITLRKEIEYLESYIFLNNIRFKNKFCFVSDIPDLYMDVRILKFIIQPIVENSILHGFEGKPGLGTIKLSLEEEGGTMVLSVTDDGVGFSEDKPDNIFKWSRMDDLETKTEHLGLKNVDRRIKLIYGERYGLRIENSAGGGARVMIVLPEGEGVQSHEDSCG